jgi:hypothetical protein
MKLGKHDITLKNIQAYLQGNIRFLAEQYGPEFIKMEPHIREQIMFRLDISKPECKENKECVECHCKVPELMYADKQCGGECYPKMMDKDEWLAYKNAIRAYTLENNIEKIEYPFNWQLINELIKQEDMKEKEDIIIGKNTNKIPDQEVNIGNKVIGDHITHTFRIHNTNSVNIYVKDVDTSCGCTTAGELLNKIIPANDYMNVQIKVDTTGKKATNHLFTTSIVFNNNTITKLIIKANLIK